MRRIREERGLTQAELAQAIGLGTVQISRIERGVQEPRFATIERLAEALDVQAGSFWQPGSEPRIDRVGVREDRPSYSGSGPHGRRLTAFARQIDRLDHDAASAALEACIALARELVKRMGRRGEQR